MKIFHLLITNIIIGYSFKKVNINNKNFIISNINNFSIINIKKMIIAILIIKKKIKKIFLNKGIILFIGTKNIVREIVYKYARSIQYPYICNKWISGTLTNSNNYKKMLNKLKLIRYQKKKNKIKKEKIKLFKIEKKIELLYGGLRLMKKNPDLIFIADINKNNIIINEAQRKQIKIVSLIDTLNNVRKIDYILPCNNNSILSINYLFKTLFSELC